MKPFLLNKNANIGLLVSQKPLERNGDIISLPFYHLENIKKILDGL